MSRSVCPPARRGVAVWCLLLPTSTSRNSQYQPSTTYTAIKVCNVHDNKGLHQQLTSPLKGKGKLTLPILDTER